MRVVKLREWEGLKRYTAHCNRCGTAFEFERRKAEYSKDRGDPVLVIKCLLCRTRVGVKHIMRNKWSEIKMWNGEICHYCEDDNLLRVAKQVWRERKAGYRVVGINVNFPF